VEIDQLGFQSPLDPSGNPVDTYDIYFSRLSSTLYGQTWLEVRIPSRPDAWSTYIEINTNLDSPSFETGGLDGLRVTAAHEFNHAIQLGYRAWEDANENLIDLFLMEMTSTFMEEYVYDEVNDYYQYLPILFNNVQKIRFTSGYGTFPYGNGIYMQMLEILYGPEIIVDLWKRIRTEKGIQALHYVLNERGSSWPKSQNRYARWLYYTGDRSIPGRFFPEASDYPMIPLRNDQKLILNEGLTIDYEIRAKALGYLVLENAANIRYKAELEGSTPDVYYSHSSAGNLDEKPGKANTLQAFYPGEADTIVIALSNPVDSTLSVTYSIEEDTLLFPGIGANPIMVSTDEDAAYFFNVPAEATIRIFNIQGRFIQALQTGSRKESRLTWNLRDHSGKPLATGIYLYILQASGQDKIGKFAVVRR
jgi:hypothetical protein